MKFKVGDKLIDRYKNIATVFRVDSSEEKYRLEFSDGSSGSYEEWYVIKNFRKATKLELALK